MPIEEFATRGKAKLDRKCPRMSESWSAARPRMKAGYSAAGFGPTRVSNYNAGVDAGVHRCDNEKWQRKWLAKMRE